MKFTSVFSVAALLASSLVSAAPIKAVSRRSVIMRRAAVDDVPDVGFAAASTTGGSGGTTTTVTTLEELTEAVKGDEAKIVIIDGTITGSEVVKVGANTSVLGAAGSLLDGVGLRAYKVDNIIFRNIKIQKVLAEAGDAIGVQEANNVWVDHCDLSSDRDHDKDFYDGLLDVTHGSTGVTLSNNYIHDHWKASLVGHSDNNGDEDAALQVTYTGNFFENLNSRGPSFRFGTGHLFNNYYSGVSDGINTRDGAQLLVENNVFVDSKKALYSTDEGFAVATGNDFGNSENTASEGTLTSMDYEYTLLDTSEVAASVQASAGQTLDFSA